MSARKMLIVGGLLFLLVSMIYGTIYAAVFLQQFSQERIRVLESGLDQRLPPKTIAEQYEKVNRAAAQHTSSHSHLSLFGLTALALGGTLNYLKLRGIWLKSATLLFLTGGFLLPAGVFLEPIYSEEIGRLIAMVGGGLLILSTVFFLLGALLAKDE